MKAVEEYRWYQLASVQIGGAICLPVILIGFELARQYGAFPSFVAIAVGNLLLMSLAYITVKMTWQNKRTTPDNVSLYFGVYGQKVIACIIGMSMCCWYAIQTQVVAHDVSAYFGIDYRITCFGCSLFFASSLLFGLHGITKLANLSIPAMILTLMIVLIAAFCKDDTQRTISWENSFSVSAISLVMAVAIGVCIDMPTFFRYAKSEQDAIAGALVTFCIGMPLIEIAGVLVYQWSNAACLTDALKCPGSALWDMWIVLFLFVAAWTTNTTNLYSASMGMKALFSQFSKQGIWLIATCFATFLSVIDLVANLSFFLDLMGTILATTFGAILMLYLMKRRMAEGIKYMAISIGALGGFSGYPTGIAVLDSALISAFIIYFGGVLYGKMACRCIDA